MPTLPNPIPTSFRHALCQQILTLLASGESCSLIGVGTSGKSNVARHLLRRDVRALHLGQGAQGTLAVLVDCMKVDVYTMQSLHRLVLQALLNALRQSDVEPVISALKNQVEPLCERAMFGESSDLVRYCLEEALQACFAGGVRQIYFILDDFDHTLRNLPGNAINSLRAMRDNYKNRLMYVTVTRHEPAFIRDESEYEDFAEIVTPHTIPVGLFDKDDADQMIETLAGRYQINPARLNAVTRTYLHALSGWHPGLLKALLNIMRDNPQLDVREERDQTLLAGHKDIEPECKKIWDSLEQEEQAALLALVQGGTAPPNEMRRLKSKQIITSAVLGSPPIFSRLFAEFVSRQTLEPDPADDSADLAATAEYSDNNRALSAWPIQVELYPDRLSVKLDGHIVRNLSPVEYALFTALYRKLGQPVPSSDLNDIAASRSTFRHLSNDERLETHMADLMAKVNVFGTKYIVREHDAYQLNAVV